MSIHPAGTDEHRLWVPAKNRLEWDMDAGNLTIFDPKNQRITTHWITSDCHLSLEEVR